MGEGVTGRGGDGQGQAGRGAGILTRAAGALLAGRVPDHAPRTRGAASRLSHGLRRALGGATPHSVLPVTPQCWGARPAGSRPRPSVRCPLLSLEGPTQPPLYCIPLTRRLPPQPDPGAKAPACLPKATHCGVPERVPSGLQKYAHLPVPAPDVNPPGDGLPARCCEPHEDRVPAPHREPHGDGGPAPGHEPHKDGVCVLCAAVESSSWSEAAGEARRGDAH